MIKHKKIILLYPEEEAEEEGDHKQIQDQD